MVSLSLSLDEAELRREFEIDRTLAVLETGGHRRIALQFPDELLAYATQVTLLLTRLANPVPASPAEGAKASTPPLRSFFVLADTTYGSCCVDEIAAQHMNSDLIIHYGRACLSRTCRIPVLYIFGKPHIDTQDCIHQTLAMLPPENTRILLTYDPIYYHAIPRIASSLVEAGYKDIVVSNIDTEIGITSGSSKTTSSVTSPTIPENSTACCSPISLCHNASTPSVPSCCKPDSNVISPVTQNDLSLSSLSLADSSRAVGRTYTFPKSLTIQDYTMLYVGPESLTLTNLVMTHAGIQVYSYDPIKKAVRHENPDVNKLLMRRYVMVQKAKDADVIGIVVGTLGVASYLSLIGHIKRLILSRGKKPYLISVGKPNPAKLANFAEIDLFVLVACPENSLIDSKEFYKPIITPHELEIALVRGREWDSTKYVTDLSLLNVSIAEQVDAEIDRVMRRRRDREERGGNGCGSESESEEDEPHFSLVSGGFKQASRHAKFVGTEDNSDAIGEGVVGVRNSSGTVSTFTSASVAGEYLNSMRSYKGLEARIGESEILIAENGRAGVASGYSHEPVSK